MAKVQLYVDGREITAQESDTVLEAALDHGIYIPHLCHYPDLKPAGICRVCVVEANGVIVPSCRAPVAAGMVVRTGGAMVDKVRRLAAELMVVNHHDDCLACGKNYDCKLQEVARYVGVDPERLKRFKAQEKRAVDETHPFIVRDYNKCILCGICVRTCDEITCIEAIDYSFRGYAAKISTLGDKPLQESKCTSCGECMVRCPVGALLPKGGVQPAYEVKTICTYCGCGCGIYLGVREGRISGVRGDRESVVNEGELCVKGRFGYSFVNHPDRLTAPLIKRNGKFEEASWDEALDLVAAKFQEVQAKYGPESLGGLSSARVTNEDNYLFQKLLRSLGSNSVDCCARL
jgi:formate dehydrogenase major subunit